MRQFRRLQRIRLKTSAARTVPENFMRRMIRANRECPWAERSADSIIHHGSCGIRHGGGCTCVPEIFITMPDGRIVTVDSDGGCKLETRQ
jgi:hypothetical protein